MEKVNSAINKEDIELWEIILKDNVDQTVKIEDYDVYISEELVAETGSLEELTMWCYGVLYGKLHWISLNTFLEFRRMKNSKFSFKAIVKDTLYYDGVITIPKKFYSNIDNFNLYKNESESVSLYNGTVTKILSYDGVTTVPFHISLPNGGAPGEIYHYLKNNRNYYQIKISNVWDKTFIMDLREQAKIGNPLEYNVDLYKRTVHINRT